MSGVWNPLLPVAEIVTAVFDGQLGPCLLSDGEPARVSLAAPTDASRVQDFYEQMSDTSTYYRFFGIRRAFPQRELLQACTTTLPDRVTLFIETPGTPSSPAAIIGIGQSVPGATADEVEVAFAVSDEHHHRGIGTLLLERLATIASRCGMQRLTAITLPGNHEMQVVFRTVGLTEHVRLDDRDGVIHVVLDLDSLEGMSAQAGARQRSAAEHGPASASLA